MIASEPQISEGGFGFTCSPNIVSSDFENGYVRLCQNMSAFFSTLTGIAHTYSTCAPIMPISPFILFMMFSRNILGAAFMQVSHALQTWLLCFC